MHSVSAVTLEVVRKKSVGALPNPATLPLVVMVAVVPDIDLSIVGVPMKCVTLLPLEAVTSAVKPIRLLLLQVRLFSCCFLSYFLAIVSGAVINTDYALYL